MMERAKSNVTIAGPSQMDRPAYHIDDVHCLLYESGNTGASQLAFLPLLREGRPQGARLRSFGKETAPGTIKGQNFRLLACGCCQIKYFVMSIVRGPSFGSSISVVQDPALGHQPL